MAQRQLQIDQETFNCSICLDLLKEPVTIPCGHSYCMSCLSTHWDGEVSRHSYSCPQCRQSFTRRPVLVKNTMLAALVEDLNRSGLSAAEAHHVYAAAGDVACDLCSGRKLKALKSCLQCLVSYCNDHLQPHYDVGALQKHKLVEPTENLQENMCSRHHEVMKMFCCTDQQCICYLCSVDQHKGHDMVLAVTKRNEMQQELEHTKKKIRQRLEQKQREVDILQRQSDTMVHSANTAVEDTDRIFRLISHLVETRRSQVKEHIRSQQESGEQRVKELQDKVHQEMRELKRTYTRLETLSQSEEHSAFIHTLASLTSSSSTSKVNEDPETAISETAPLTFSHVLTAAVAELQHQLEDMSSLYQAVDLLSSSDSQVSFSTQTELLGPSPADVLQTQEEPTSRAEFLAYACNMTLDPNTAHPLLFLSAHNNIVRYMNWDQDPRDHPERFTDFAQVLTKEALSGRCYLEVKGRCEDYFSVVVAHKDIRREGAFDECSFGNNTKSWALDCYKDGFVFWHNKVSTTLTAPPSNKIGIYADSDAGLLSFYSVGQDMVLILRVQIAFTQPLLAGVWLKDVADCAEICSLT